jgi:hypothetical protein
MARKKTTSKSTISGPSKSESRRWEIESAISTLQRAEQIRKDSALMRDVKKSVMDLEKSIMGSNTKKK